MALRKHVQPAGKEGHKKEVEVVQETHPELEKHLLEVAQKEENRITAQQEPDPWEIELQEKRKEKSEKRTTHREQLFSLETLPSDREFLSILREKVNSILGDGSVDLRSEILENLTHARSLRDELLMSDTEREHRAAENDDYEPPEAISPAAKISAITAFTAVVQSIVKLQDIIFSQQATSLLQATILDVLGNYNYDIQSEVVELFKERIQELEEKMARK